MNTMTPGMEDSYRDARAVSGAPCDCDNSGVAVWVDTPTVAGFYWLDRGFGHRLVVAEYRVPPDMEPCVLLPGSQEFGTDHWEGAKWFGPIVEPITESAK